MLPSIVFSQMWLCGNMLSSNLPFIKYPTELPSSSSASEIQVHGRIRTYDISCGLLSLLARCAGDHQDGSPPRCVRVCHERSRVREASRDQRCNVPRQDYTAEPGEEAGGERGEREGQSIDRSIHEFLRRDYSGKLRTTLRERNPTFDRQCVHHQFDKGLVGLDAPRPEDSSPLL